MLPVTIHSEQAAFWVLGGALALGAILWLAAGPAAQLIYPADSANYLDACHRTSVGQWLGRDYTSPIGPAAILPAALAMRLGQPTVGALGWPAAAVVMEPRHSLQPDSLAFKRALFASALTADFVLAGETVHWRLWLRKPVPPA